MFLELFFHDSFLVHHLSKKLLLMISIQEHLCQLLQTVSPSKMLPITLCLDALFGDFKQSAKKKSKIASQKVT